MELYSRTVNKGVSLPNDPEIFDRVKLDGTFNSQSVYPDELSDIQIDDDLSVFDEADDIFLYYRSLFIAGTPTIDEDVRSTDITRNSSTNDIGECSNSFENASPLLQAKEPELEIPISEGHFNMPEEDMSVFLDLQRSTLQLAKKTRICFRDYFYRLAENSRFQADCIQNGKENLENCQPTTSSSGPFRLNKSYIDTSWFTYRLLESDAEISDNNAINKTVATLLFNTMKCCNLEIETPTTINLDSISICAVAGGDAEV
ncbi:hypothetical protein CASFOL_031822 [Castilleja foliolosa]|uniref:Uncharacterized protein n=1 Tax=Castilleja foliolosa TaxID=1961234 RepID=A0ABD3C1H1_9LAMI